MLKVSKMFLVCFFALCNLLTINGRCGLPQLPFMSSPIEPKEYFEEGETLLIKCISGVVITDGFHSGLIECRNNSWNSTSIRCTKLQNVSLMNIITKNNEPKDDEMSKLKKQELANLFDKNPLSCVPLFESEKWVFSLNQSRIVTNIAIMTLMLNNQTDNNSVDISVELSSTLCEMEDNNLNANNSVVLFTVYKCPLKVLTDTISLSYGSYQTDISICGIEIFTIDDENCGQPQLPFYSFANQFQNNSKQIEYSCAKGYHLVGDANRNCGSDGLWYPPTAPVCLPDIQCSKRKQNFAIEHNGTFRYEFADLDHYGHAIPEMSSLIYNCINETDVISENSIRYCQMDGNWSALYRTPECHPRRHAIFELGHHLVIHRYYLYYGISFLVLLFVVCAVILYHMRRLAKRISRQMRENAYKLQDKVLPNYNNESNYQDITAVFAASEANAPTNAQPDTPKF